MEQSAPAVLLQDVKKSFALGHGHTLEVLNVTSLAFSHDGKFLLIILSTYTAVLCLFLPLFLTADCISEEKREGIIGLLFLTELHGYDFVLGKFIAGSLNAFYGLLALLPVMAISLLFGGLTGAEFWRIALALLNTLFVSLVAGICVSAFSRDARVAMAATFLVLLSLAILPSRSVTTRFAACATSGS